VPEEAPGVADLGAALAAALGLSVGERAASLGAGWRGLRERADRFRAGLQPADEPGRLDLHATPPAGPGPGAERPGAA
jgi:hypothetical protein